MKQLTVFDIQKPCFVGENWVFGGLWALETIWVESVLLPATVGKQ